MNIAIRDATEKDMRFVRKLAPEIALHGVPYTRNVTNQTVRARAKASIRDIFPGDLVNVLIAFDQDDPREKAMGYMILDMTQEEGSTGERQAYIFDLGIAPEHRGSLAVKRLLYEAARRTAKAGMKYLVGDVTRHNERSYFQALRFGFELERYRIAMACSEEGPIPMPGRPDSQRYYDVDRGAKKSRTPLVPGNWEELKASRRRQRESR